jgi:hypothetical protein
MRVAETYISTCMHVRIVYMCGNEQRDGGR